MKNVRNTSGQRNSPREVTAIRADKGGHFHPFPPDGGAIYQKYQKGVDGQSLCWGALEKADMPPEGMPDEQIAAWAVERLQAEARQAVLSGRRFRPAACALHRTEGVLRSLSAGRDRRAAGSRRRNG